MSPLRSAHSTSFHFKVMVVTPTTIPMTELGPPLGAVRNTELSHYTQLIIVWLPEVEVSAVIVLDLEPSSLMAFTVMVYILSSFKLIRLYDLALPRRVFMPCLGLAEHLLIVYMYETSYLSIKIPLDCVHVMVIDVAVTMVTVRLLGTLGITPVIRIILLIIGDLHMKQAYV